MVIERPPRHVMSGRQRCLRLATVVAAVSVFAGACGSGADDTSATIPSTEIAVDEDSDDLFIETPSESTETESRETTNTETTSPEASPDTTIERTTATPNPDFAVSITEIDLDAGTITISNHGDTDVDLGDLWICEFPEYAQLDARTLAAGDQVTLPNPHASSADDGELALYRTDDFADPDTILSYVEWGAAGHERASIAAEAGVWGDDAVDSGLVLGTSGSFAIDASGWSVLTKVRPGSVPGDTIREDNGGAPQPPAPPPPDDYSPAAPQPPARPAPSTPPPPDDY